jgi:hypothetical protein
MAYIGKTPVIGNFQVCDAISVVDAQAAYTMQVGGVNVSPESANHMLVSLNGILQAPTSSFTVSGSTITFASNLVTGDVIDFIQILGNVLDLGVPSDNTVTTAKLANSSVSLAKLTATGTKDATTFLRGDNTFAAAGGIFESQLLHVTHETADGTAGGATGSSSWTTRTINTIKTNEISGTLTSNVISLGVGDYWLEGGAFFTNSGYIQTRFRDTTSGTNLIIGCNTYSEGYAGAWNTISGRFTLSGTKNLEVQYYCTTAYATQGQGMAAPASGEVNRFADFKIWKI